MSYSMELMAEEKILFDYFEFMDVEDAGWHKKSFLKLDRASQLAEAKSQLEHYSTCITCKASYERKLKAVRGRINL